MASPTYSSSAWRSFFRSGNKAEAFGYKTTKWARVQEVVFFMCHRVTPVTMEELQLALDLYQTTGHARIPKDAIAPKDAYPGAKLPTIVRSPSGGLAAEELIWGFSSSQPKRNRVFNTRLETALSQLRMREGMWADAITLGRCLVPVRAFYESWTRTASPAQDPNPKTQVRFTLEGFNVFLIAAVCQGGEVSLITTVPNKTVGRIHSRMPLVLGPGESSVWLSANFPKLADRSAIRLTTQVIPQQQ